MRHDFKSKPRSKKEYWASLNSAYMRKQTSTEHLAVYLPCPTCTRSLRVNYSMVDKKLSVQRKCKCVEGLAGE